MELGLPGLCGRWLYPLSQQWVFLFYEQENWGSFDTCAALWTKMKNLELLPPTEQWEGHCGGDHVAVRADVEDDQQEPGI